MLFLSLYLLIPAYVTHFHYLPPFALIVFYPLNILIWLYAFRVTSARQSRLEIKTQSFQEKINLLSEQNSVETKNKLSLQEKISRYNSLRKIIEQINQNLFLDSIANSLTEISFSLIANGKGVCMLYLVDERAQGITLNLFKARKEDKRLVVKTKEGDIFDLWVLRHAVPLIVEDVRKDFRFDMEKLKSHDQRPVLSLVSSPFVTENNFLGTLRLDSPVSGFYSQDDLRFLVSMCDLGAVALENARLFQKTQELAIHDGLTGLFTKKYFMERLKEECKRSVRRDTDLALFLLDIDYFKNYNDKFGHTAGDIVLKKLGVAITDSLKEFNSIISRFGGEEFCAILPRMDKRKACMEAERLRAQVEAMKIILREKQTGVSVSIGVASFPDDANDEDDLIFKADRAMYKAKQKGRNRVACV